MKFTAHMEEKLDDVEEGKAELEGGAAATSTSGFQQETVRQAEKDLEGVRIKVPDEVTEEVCDLCGRNMVIKIRPVRPVPGLPRLPGVQVHQASGGGDAGPLPQVRRAAAEAHGQEPKPASSIPTTAASKQRPAARATS